MSDSCIAAEFEKAAEFLRVISSDLDPPDLLYFYARYKQAKLGPNDTPKPGFFEFQGKQKWQAWKELADMPPETAMREYVCKLNALDPGWLGKEPAKVAGSGGGGGGGGWVSVSAMVAPQEDVIPDAEKSLFDWVKEGNAVELKRMIESGKCAAEAAIAAKDNDGMALLHWAADRGDAAVVATLLDLGADVNETDEEGQTALHYAASCGHLEVAELLLDRDADVRVCDTSGLTAAKVAEDQRVRDLFSKMGS